MTREQQLSGSRKPLTPLEIYNRLERSNCGRCLLPSCLAFAAALVAGTKKPSDCPFLSPSAVAEISQALQPRFSSPVQEQDGSLDRLQEKLATIDLSTVAPRIGGTYANGLLTINSLGKDFHVDQRGRMTSRCHIIPWVRMPLLSYVINPTHQQPTGNWISFRELEGGLDWQGLFHSRCENPLRKLADANPGLLSDLVELFNARSEDLFAADIALVLHPLPHIPLLIAYQAPEDDLESKLTILFDRCCATNLPIKSIFTLCSGLVRMFARIARQHG